MSVVSIEFSFLFTLIFTLSTLSLCLVRTSVFAVFVFMYLCPPPRYCVVRVSLYWILYQTVKSIKLYLDHCRIYIILTSFSANVTLQRSIA